MRCTAVEHGYELDRMSDDTSTDPYNGELPDDADLESPDSKDLNDDPDDDDALDDAEHLLPDGSGLTSEGDGSGALP